MLSNSIFRNLFYTHAHIAYISVQKNLKTYKCYLLTYNKLLQTTIFIEIH